MFNFSYFLFSCFFCCPFYLPRCHVIPRCLYCWSVCFCVNYKLHCQSIVGCESTGACLLLLLSLGGAFTSVAGNFDNKKKILVVGETGGTRNYSLYSSQLFRGKSGKWRHIVRFVSLRLKAKLQCNYTDLIAEHF